MMSDVTGFNDYNIKLNSVIGNNTRHIKIGGGRAKSKKEAPRFSDQNMRARLVGCAAGFMVSFLNKKRNAERFFFFFFFS